YAVGFNPSFIATGDFNSDGNVDVAVAGKSGLAIFLNGGKSNLKKPFLYSLSKTPTAITTADFNNDGLADVALANADGTVSILLGNGAGSFRSLPDISVAVGSLSSIVSGDFNKDGKIDLVITNRPRSWYQSCWGMVTELSHPRRLILLEMSLCPRSWQMRTGTALPILS